MKNIFKIYSRDLKKIFTNSIAIILVVGILVLPSLYAWFNIYANWDPYGKTGNMMVAVANEDEGASYKSIEIDIGNQICDNLRGNDAIDWQFVSKKDAVRGVESGRYYAAIEIPSGFSKNLASIVTDDYERPQIIYYANEKKNAIATKITDKVVQTVQTSVNESFVTSVVDVMSIVLGTAVEKNSFSNGGNTFDYLKKEIKEARGTIGALNGSLNSLKDLLSMAQEMDVALDDKDLENLLDSTGNLIDDTTDAIEVTTVALNSSLDSVDKMITSTCATLDNTANMISGVADKDMSGTINTMKSASAELINVKDDLDQIATTLTKINNALPKPIDDVTVLVNRLQRTAKSLNEISNSINKLASVDYDKNAYDIAARIREASANLSSAQKNYKNDVEPALSEAVSSLLITLGDLSDMIDALQGNTPSINALVSAVNKGVKTGDDMLSTITGVLDGTDEKLKSLYNVVDNISNSEVVNAVVNLTTENGGDLGEFLACPVEVKTDKIYGIENYGSAMAPFYSTLAIWVGAMFLAAVVKVKIKKSKEIAPKLKIREQYFGRGLLYISFAIVQSVIICLGDLYFFKIQCYHPVMYMFAGILAAVVFSLFIYSLVFTFGDLGKAVGVILLVIQIGGSGGTFPIHVTQDFFVAVNPYLPFTFVIEAMRECICGTYGNDYWMYIGKLLIYVVISLLIGLPVKHIVKKPVTFFEKRSEETGLF